LPDSTFDPPTTRRGQLQRGRGIGFLTTCGIAAARDDLLQCILHDPRIDTQVESRGRYFAELFAASDLPIEPIVATIAGKSELELAHEVLAGAWVLGHVATRNLLAANDSDGVIVDAIAASLWDTQWARPVELPPRAAAAWLRCQRDVADCAVAAAREPNVTALAGRSVAELLELARGPQGERRDRLLGELCARDDAATRSSLLAVVSDDFVYERVRLAARALGLCGDERPLPLAETLFAREDVFEDASRRLSGSDRMRRACLADYVRHLPVEQALPLARSWRGRGGYFEVVVGGILREHASAADRESLEAWVHTHADADGGTQVIDELDALARLGDPRSAPLLIEIATTATYSHARRRAVHGLAFLAEIPAAAAVLHEALWDAEDEAAADATAFLPSVDAAALARIDALADSKLTEPELAARAERRRRRERL
jgi:hypothetical protein